VALDLLSLPQTLRSLDSVSPEYRGLYQSDCAGWFRLTPTAAADFSRIAAAVEQLAEQRNNAESAVLSSAVIGAILICGAQSVMAGAAAAQYESEHVISMVSGVPCVQTPLGAVPVFEAIKEWMTTGHGAVFLPNEFARPQQSRALS
jgi:hypothetical protein